MFSPLDHRLRVVIGTGALASSLARSCIHVIISASNHALAHFPMRRKEHRGNGKYPERSHRAQGCVGHIRPISWKIHAQRPGAPPRRLGRLPAYREIGIFKFLPGLAGVSYHSFARYAAAGQRLGPCQIRFIVCSLRVSGFQTPKTSVSLSLVERNRNCCSQGVAVRRSCGEALSHRRKGRDDRWYT
jgi:hypothetical protein